MTPEFHRHDRWWVSPFNVTDQVRRSFSLPPRAQIHDATLRDGEQTPGVVFSVADKIAIAEALAAVGVDRIEAGMPAVSDDDFAAVRQITKLGLTSKIYTFVRAITADIDKSRVSPSGHSSPSRNFAKLPSACSRARRTRRDH